MLYKLLKAKIRLAQIKINNQIMCEWTKWMRTTLIILLLEIISLTSFINYHFLSQTSISTISIVHAQSQDMGALVPAEAYLDIETTESKISTPGKDTPSDTGSVQSLIRKVAQAENFENVDGLLRLAHCESRFNPKSFNPTNNSNDRGAFQISKRYHPTVTDEQAYDVTFATKWTINKIKAGGINMWMCAHAYNDDNYSIN